MSGPETLADVKAGDIVWLARSHLSGGDDPVQITVSRVGRKFGYFQNGWCDAKFDLRSGDVEDRPYGTAYRSLDALKRAAETERLKLQWHKAWSTFKAAAGEIYGPPSREKFTSLRDVFFAAEAALRELGEWEDTPCA